MNFLPAELSVRPGKPAPPSLSCHPGPRFPQDQDAVNLRQNYAAFLQEMGRHHEADAFKARAALV